MNPFELLNRYNLPKINSVLQVGASGGQEIPLFRENNITHCLLIEPLDYPFSILCKNVCGIENYIPMKTLVGANDNEDMKIYIASNDGQSSSVLKPAEHISIFPNVKFEHEIISQSFTLDSIVKYNNYTNIGSPKAYDLIYIDVQGAELEVFKGASKSLISSSYVFTEVGYGGGYCNDSTYLEIIQYLNVFGFKLISIDVDPNVGYGNAFFVNKKLLT